MSKSIFRFYSSLSIFFLAIVWVFVAIGSVEYFHWQSVIFSGLMIHLGIILVCIMATLVLIRDCQGGSLFYALSCKKAKWQYYGVAFLVVIFIWIADFWLQLFYFLDKGEADQLALLADIRLFGASSVISAHCLIGPLAEELLFRGVLLKGLRDKLGVGWAIFISALVFAAVHLSLNDFLTLFIAAIVYGILSVKSGSLFPAMLAHVLNNSLTVYYLLTLPS